MVVIVQANEIRRINATKAGVIRKVSGSVASIPTYATAETIGKPNPRSTRSTEDEGSLGAKRPRRLLRMVTHPAQEQA